MFRLRVTLVGDLGFSFELRDPKLGVRLIDVPVGKHHLEYFEL